MLGEFIRILQGHLQCISASSLVRKEVDPDTVLNEFAILYTLALQPAAQRKLIPLFSIAAAVVDSSNRVKRIISNYPRFLLEKLLLENAQKCKDGKLQSINYLFMIIFLTMETGRQSFLRKCRLLSALLPIDFDTISIDMTGTITMDDTSHTINIGGRVLLHINFIQQQLQTKKRMPTMGN